MHSHLIKIFDSNMIEHFSQDSNYGTLQKMLPLAIIKIREVRATRQRHDTSKRNRTKNKSIASKL